MDKILEMLFGKEGGFEQISTLTPEQQKLFYQYMQSLQGKGAGGAAGEAADYWRDILSNDSETMKQMEAPMMRKFQQDIIPGLAEQYAGMGSGATSSSSFRRGATQAGVDLSERLASMRAGLRQNAASGLTGMYNNAFNSQVENMYRKPTYGATGALMDFAGKAAPGFGTAIGKPVGEAAGAAINKYFG